MKRWEASVTWFGVDVLVGIDGGIGLGIVLDLEDDIPPDDPTPTPPFAVFIEI